MANTGVNLLWEPDAKNRAKNRLLAALQNATSSEPGAQGPGTGYGGGVSPGGGTIADLAQQDVANVANQQLPSDYVAQTAQQAAAQGRKDPNISDLLKLAATFPELAVQEAVQAAISGLTLPGDVASGKQQLTDPTTGHITDQSLGRVLDLTGLAASGSVAGPAEAATGDLLGSGPVRKPVVIKPTEAELSAERVKADAMFDNGDLTDEEYDDMLAHVEQGGKVDQTSVDVSNDDAQASIDARKGQTAAAGVIQKPTLNSGSKEQAAVAEAAGQAPELYSHAARVVDALPAGKAPASQWLSTLKNKGVKDEELEALKLPADNTPLTKDQLKAQIDASTPQLRDVVKGGDTGHPQYTQDDVDNEEAQARRTGNWTRFEEVQAEHEAQQLGHGTAANYLDESDVEDAVTDEFAADFRRGNPNATDEDVDAYLADDATVDAITEEAYSRIDAKGPPTKYSQYQLPGGENYREILTTLPAQGKHWRLTEFHAIDKNGQPVVYPQMDFATRSEAGAAAKTRQNQQLTELHGINDGGDYRSSHWDEPNVLAHTRVNDRMIPEEGFSVYNRASGNKSPVFATRAEADAYKANLPATLQGNTYVIGDTKPVKTLHAEELQSDWHQQGKKQGYASAEKDKYELSNALAASNAARLRILRQVYGFDPEHRPPGARVTDDMMQQARDAMAADSAYNEAQAVVRRYQDTGRMAARNNIPDAPFKKAWPDLLLKKLALRAHNEGYDAISWTDGATQADRYDLSKTVKDVFYEKQDDGTYELTGHSIDGRPHVFGERVAADKLDDFVGKELADKIRKGEGKDDPDSASRVLSGAALKVGGEGMKAFYDQELPRRAKKILGAPVEEKYLGIAPPGDRGGENAATIHFVRLTPEVRDRIKKGFPLFASGAPVPAQTQTDPTPRVGQTRTMRLTRVPAIPQAGAPTIDRTHDVPAFAGSSNDNKTVYVDRHVPTQMNIDGKVIDPAKYLQVHEQFEHDLMANRKLPYDVAHRQATAAERAAVEADGIDWKSYEAHINGMLHAIETEPLKDEPDDLYTKVYHTPEWGKRASEIDRATHRRHIDTRIK